MKQTLILAALLLAGCIDEREYEQDQKFDDLRIEGLQEQVKGLETRLMSHLCEYHKPDYDCITFTDFVNSATE